jgi:hypothetical protein
MCPSNCDCQSVCTCNTDQYCVCNNDNYRKCSVKEDSKSISSYTWTDDNNLSNINIKSQHIIEIKNALKSEAERRAYIDIESVTDTTTTTCPSNTLTIYKDIERVTSSILGFLNQSETITINYTSIALSSWLNIVNFIEGNPNKSLKTNISTCSANITDYTGDLYNLSTTLDTYIKGAISLQNIIKSIDNIRLVIDEINRRCVCDSKAVCDGCYQYYICTTHSPHHCSCNLNIKNTYVPCSSNYVGSCNCNYTKKIYQNHSRSCNKDYACLCYRTGAYPSLCPKAVVIGDFRYGDGYNYVVNTFCVYNGSCSIFTYTFDRNCDAFSDYFHDIAWLTFDNYSNSISFMGLNSWP